MQAKHLITANSITVTTDLMAIDAIQRMEHNRRKQISVLPVVNAAGELDEVLRRCGGHGAVRELAEHILKARGLWTDLSRNGWRYHND